GGTIKLVGTSLVLAVNGTQNAVDLFASGGLGSDRGNRYSIDEGADGRILLGDNDDSSELARTQVDISTSAVREIVGPTAVNPYLHGDLGLGQATPYIPNLLGGSQIYGFLDGITIDQIDFNPQSTERDAPDSDALLAVLRLPGGLDDIGLGNHPSAISFPGFDWVLVANVTGQNLSSPRIGIGIHSSDITTETTDSPLAFDDLDIATAGPQTLSALNAGKVWVTLIPSSAATQTVRVNASLAGDATVEGTLSNLAAATLGTGGENQVAYITANRPALGTVGIANADASFTGFKEIATGNSGEIYALSADRNAMVLLDGTDYRVLQVIENNFDGVSNFHDLRNITASPDGEFVRVQVGDRGLATLARDSSTGVLTFLQLQVPDAGLSPFFRDYDSSLQKIVINDIDHTAIALFELTDPVDGITAQRLKAYTIDNLTGVLTAIPNVPDAFNLHEGEIDSAVGETFVDVTNGPAITYLLTEQASDQRLNSYRVVAGTGFAGLGTAVAGADFGFTGAD
ncbi:MAG: hypothetical protein KDB23_31480, partial [Planctomycetales bacterium]|nr:hypothetical protein [Planctomycetales bacterium]